MRLTEGKIDLELPLVPVSKGPGKRNEGFYNPSQRINRDLTILFLSIIRPTRFLDAFGGSGIRGLRVAGELGIETVISEINPASCKVAMRNASLNNSSAEIYNESFEKSLERKLFDFIDVDPYGSIVPYVDRAITSVKNHGHIGVTATDLSSLTGSVPTKTLRRYGARISNDDFRHEMGIRLLISYVVRRAAAFDIGALPVVSFWHSHFYRIIFRIDRGASKADSAVMKIKNVNKKELLSEFYPSLAEGPVWIGDLEDSEAISAMVKGTRDYIDNKSIALANCLQYEDLSFLYLELTHIASRSHSDMPPLKAAVQELDEHSVKSARTHFSNTGLKVSNPVTESYDLISSFLSGKHA